MASLEFNFKMTGHALNSCLTAASLEIPSDERDLMLQHWTGVDTLLVFVSVITDD